MRNLEAFPKENVVRIAVGALCSSPRMFHVVLKVGNPRKEIELALNGKRSADISC